MKYPARNQRFYDPRSKDSKDINRVPSLYNLSPEARDIFEKQHPKKWYEATPAYVKRLERTFADAASPRQLQGIVVYNADPTKDFFASRKLNPKQRSYVSLDIETDDYGHPISISALKFQYDKKQKQFISVDNYQRFYKAHSWNLRSTEAVHGFTASSLRSLRRQQGAHYGSTYRGSEIDDLQSFLGLSIIVGHNIQQFDLDKLFSDRIISNSTIDTLAAARNAWAGKRNDLDTVFHRLFGKTMEEAGLSHHDANADTVASMMILEKMHTDPGEVGQAIRYVMGSKGHRQLVELDSMLDSMVVKGTYKSTYAGKGGNRRLNEVYMTAEEIGLKKKGKWVGGFHEDVPVNLDQMSDEQLLKSAFVDAAQYMKKAGGGIGGMSEDLFEAVNQFNNYKRLSLVKQIASAKSEESIDALMNAAGYKVKGDSYNTFREMADRIRMAKEKEDVSAEQERKKEYLNKMEKSGAIKHWQKEELDLQHGFGRLSSSYDDLVDATQEMIDMNQKLERVYRSIASIKPYDMNQMIGSAHNQWGGIMGASRGVLPSFVRNTLGRLGDATFNVIDRSIAPWNAAGRIINSVVNPLMGGAGGGAGGAGIGGGGSVGAGRVGLGIFNAGTQIVGNVAQAKMEMFGYNIQNNLNTLGAMISWISTPFQLLHKALKLAIGSLGGFSLKLNSIMAGGIDLMSQMGNPLEQMTGVDYLKYQGTTLMDLASLQGKGSTNSAIESFATMQRNLYRFGQVDTGKLLAANMLGVFNEAFTPTTDAAGAYYNMGNKILHNMMAQSPEQQADTLYYVNQLNSSLAQTIRSALMMGVTDLHQLTDPSAFHQMYWRPISDTEEGNFRRTQYEYGTAKQQFGYSKMRFADRLWNSIGRDLYNGLNELVDRAAGGDWKGVLESAGEMWETLKVKFKEVWSGKDGEGGIGDKIMGGLSTAWDKIKEWGVNIARGIIDIWNQIFGYILDKAQGLIAYLSTVQVGFVKDKKTGKWGIDIQTVRDATVADNELIYDTTAMGSYSGAAILSQKAAGGMEGYAALVDALFPGMSKKDKRHLTKADLREKLHNLPGVIKDGVLDTPEVNLEDYHIAGLNLGHNPELIEPLLDLLGMMESGGTGFRVQGAWGAADKRLKAYQTEGATDIPGLMNTYQRFTEDVNEVVGTAASYISGRTVDENKNKDAHVVFDFKLGDKTATATYTQGKGLTFTGMPLLQQVGLGNGISVAVSQRR